MGVIPLNRRLDNLVHVVPPLRENPTEPLFLDAYNTVVNVSNIPSDILLPKTMDLPEHQRIADMLLQTASHLQYQEFKSYVVCQKDHNNITDLGHPCESHKIAIASLFGTGIYSLIMALPLIDKLNFLNSTDSFECLVLVRPGGGETSVLKFCMLAVIYELEHEADVVSSELYLESFESFEAYCHSNVQDDSVTKMALILSFIVGRLKDKFSFLETLGKAKEVGKLSNNHHLQQNVSVTCFHFLLLK
ncbi:hypothetical protein GEMRC1_010647 [Eukaryota sp. GEM-RC1]